MNLAFHEQTFPYKSLFLRQEEIPDHNNIIYLQKNKNGIIYDKSEILRGVNHFRLQE